MSQPDIAANFQQFGDVLKLLRWRKDYQNPVECGCPINERNPLAVVERVAHRCAHVCGFLDGKQLSDSRRRKLHLIKTLWDATTSTEFLHYWENAVRDAEGLDKYGRCYCSPGTAAEAAAPHPAVEAKDSDCLPVTEYDNDREDRRGLSSKTRRLATSYLVSSSASTSDNRAGVGKGAKRGTKRPRDNDGEGHGLTTKRTKVRVDFEALTKTAKVKPVCIELAASTPNAPAVDPDQTRGGLEEKEQEYRDICDEEHHLGQNDSRQSPALIGHELDITNHADVEPPIITVRAVSGRTVPVGPDFGLSAEREDDKQHRRKGPATSCRTLRSDLNRLPANIPDRTGYTVLSSASPSDANAEPIGRRRSPSYFETLPSAAETTGTGTSDADIRHPGYIGSDRTAITVQPTSCSTAPRDDQAAGRFKRRMKRDGVPGDVPRAPTGRGRKESDGRTLWATNTEPLILSADEVATAPPEVRDYLNILQRQRRDRAPRTKSAQLVSTLNVEVSLPSLPSGGSSTPLETETQVAAFVATLLPLIQTGGADQDKLERLVKELLAGAAARSAASRAHNGDPTPALAPGEPQQLPPTSDAGQQPGTTGHAPNGISTEPAANQNYTEPVPSAGAVQLGGETKPRNALKQEPIDVDMFTADQTETPKALPELAGPDSEQLKTLVAWGEKHWPKTGLYTFRPKQRVTGGILDALLRIELKDTAFVLGVPPSKLLGRRDNKSGTVLLYHVNNENQLSANGQDHWVISITDLTRKTFTAYGMQTEMFDNTKANHEATFGNLDGASHQLGPFAADNCCAFQCCNALRSYLGRDPERQDGPWPSLRLFYLKRLLDDWVRQDDGAVLLPPSPVSAQHADQATIMASTSVTSRSADTDGAKPSKQAKNRRRKTKASETVDHTETRQSKARCEWKDIEKGILRVDPFCRMPLFNRDDLPDPNILKLAAVVRSRSAIYQFRDLVSSWRRPGTPIPFNSSDDVDVRMKGYMRRIETGESGATFHKLLVRCHLFRFARDVEELLDGRTRLDQKTKATLLKSLQVKDRTLERLIHDGKQWRDICGGRSGLLCFIPLDNNHFGISATDYLDMTPKAVTAFHLLDDEVTSRLDKAGSAFLESLDRAAEPVEFGWEEENVGLENLKDLLPYLESRQIPREDCYDPAEYPDWPKHPDWPWPWPADPTSIPENEKQCELCDQTTCDCVTNLPTPKPRIISLGQKGRGLQAVADSPGQVAYEAGVIIGYLFGKIAPPGTYDDDWAMDLVRADISMEPVVCQVTYAEVGNCFRLLNHSCQPVAQLRGMRVSGRYRTAVVAVTDIYDGTEITVDYGRSDRISELGIDVNLGEAVIYLSVIDSEAYQIS